MCVSEPPEKIMFLYHILLCHSSGHASDLARRHNILIEKELRKGSETRNQFLSKLLVGILIFYTS